MEKETKKDEELKDMVSDDGPTTDTPGENTLSQMKEKLSQLQEGKPILAGDGPTKTMKERTSGEEFGIRQKTTGLSFSTALDFVKHGRAMRRQNWNGKGMGIFMKKGSKDKSGITPFLIEGVPIEAFDSGSEDTETRMPCLCLQNANGNIVEGWVPSQVDMFAEDWFVVE